MARKRPKSSKPSTFCSEFPPDLLGQILGRLPVKTLLQFRCVSKGWRSLIDSSDFASLHFTLYNNTRQNPPLFLIERGLDCLIRRRDTFRKIGQFGFPNDLGNIKPIDYTNGFILCAKVDDNVKVVSFLVSNPSTRRLTEIPYPCSSSLESYLPGEIRAVLVGPPAVPPKPNDGYKLVAIPCGHPSWKRSITNRQRNPSTVIIQVYSFNTGSWRGNAIHTLSVCFLRHCARPMVLLNGAVHWIGCNPLNEIRIVAFDVQDYVIRYLRLPNDVQFGILSVVHESLVLLESENECYNMWVMERYGVDESWVHHLKIVTNDDNFRYLRRNGELFFRTGKQGVKVYDTKSRQIEDLATSYSKFISYMDTFVETLALPPGS